MEVLLSIIVFVMIMAVAAQSLSNSFFIVHRLNQKSYLLLKAFEFYTHRSTAVDQPYSEDALYVIQRSEGKGSIPLTDRSLEYHYVDFIMSDHSKDRVRTYYPLGDTDEE